MKISNFYLGFVGKTKMLDKVEITILQKLLIDFKMEKTQIIAIHGGSEGSEIQFHQLAINMDFEVYVYPAIESKNRLTWRSLNLPNVKIFPEDDSMKRITRIIKETSVLIVAPEGKKNSRNEVWASVDKAKKLNKQVITIENLQ